MIFLVCRKQKGIGCDYTIGCGMRFDYMDAPSVEALVEMIVYPEGQDEYCTLNGEQALDEILIISAEFVKTVDVSALLAEYQESESRRKRQDTEASELALLEILKRKYNQP